MHFANVNGGVKHYLDEGPREAPSLVFINSLGTDFRIWNDRRPTFDPALSRDPTRQTRTRLVAVAARPRIHGRFRD